MCKDRKFSCSAAPEDTVTVGRDSGGVYINIREEGEQDLTGLICLSDVDAIAMGHALIAAGQYNDYNE